MRLHHGIAVASALSLALASVSSAQDAATPPAPTPLPTPAITGPVQSMPPAIFEAKPFGKIAVNGFLTGSGMVQSNHIPGDDTQQAALSNGQVFIQKTDGWFQFYLQAGAYTMPSLGVPFLATDKTITNFYGPVPVAYLKLQAGKNTSFEIGSLPTLMGAEYTFTFENMNIERGLLWNQENAVTRGIQVNQTMGKVTASLSWNDNFYSNRYSAMSGSLTYANGPHSLAFVGMGNFGQTKFQTLATPVQNNGSMYVGIYTYSKGSWIIQPYYQYSSVPTNKSIGVEKGASTNGFAILANHTFKKGFSLPVRYEYIASTGKKTDPDLINLIFGPGSKGTSITVTPTFQYGGFFFRGDVSFVHAIDFTPGAVFGLLGRKENQTRAMGEIGFVFGNNIVEKK
jgi:putative OmpL-like beta-barrel porin-2